MDEYYFLPLTYNFTERLQNSHIYISESANTMMYGNSLSLADNLANAITQYQNGCNPESIRNLRYWITQAQTRGVVKTGSEVLSKLQEKEQRIFDLETEIELQKEKFEKDYSVLKEKHEELSINYIRLQAKYEELQEKWDRMIPKLNDEDLV